MNATMEMAPTESSWPTYSDDELSPRQREMRDKRMTRERESRQRLLSTPQTLEHALEVSPQNTAHLRDGDRYFVVSARVTKVTGKWTMAFAKLLNDEGELVEDVKSVAAMKPEKGREKLAAARVPATRPLWLPVHGGTASVKPHLLPDTVHSATPATESVVA